MKTSEKYSNMIVSPDVQTFANVLFSINDEEVVVSTKDLPRLIYQLQQVFTAAQQDAVK